MREVVCTISTHCKAAKYFHELQFPFACLFLFNVKQARRVLCTLCICCAYKHKLWAVANIVALEVVLPLQTHKSCTSFCFDFLVQRLCNLYQERILFNRHLFKKIVFLL